MGKNEFLVRQMKVEVRLPESLWEKCSDKREWSAYRRKTYQVWIQKAFTDQEYNVPGKKGMVFNCFEQSEIYVENYDFVVTGIAGEMWPIHESSLKGYQIDSIAAIGAKARPFWTKSGKIVYYAIQIPVEDKFSVKLESGFVLQGNADGVEHGEGDYLLCTSFEDKDYRIINGSIFHDMYERI